MINCCSIILISHERQNLLKKSFKYYQKYFNNIIILDSSRLNSKELFKKQKCAYFHLPGFSLTKKILYGLNKTKLNFVLIVPDDDFIFPKVVSRGLKFLKKNRDYISFGGKYLSFSLFKKIFKYQLLYRGTYSSYESDDPLKRLKMLTKMHPQLTYYLYRRKFLVKVFQIFKSFSHANFPELIISLAPIIYGKHKHVDSIWMIRDGAVHTDYTNKKSKVIKSKFMIYKFNKNILKDKLFINFLKKYHLLSKSFIKDKKKINYYLKNYLINHQLEKKKFFKVKDRFKLLVRNNIYGMFKFIYYIISNKLKSHYKFSKLEIKQIKNLEKIVINKN